MKRIIVGGVLTALSLCAAAEIKRPPEEDLKLLERPFESLTAEEKVRRNEAFHLKELIETGGYIPYPGTPAGSIRFVNLQKRVPSSDLQKVLKAFNSMIQYDVKIVDGDCDATVKVKIIEDGTAPLMLVAPEDKWAQINVSKLGDANTKPAFLAARLRKEMVRSISFLAAGTSHDMPLFMPISKPSDLDQVTERGFAVDIIMRMKNYFEAMGVAPYERATYRAVVSQGYDIAPTNDYQKAIYDELKKNGKLKAKAR